MMLACDLIYDLDGIFLAFVFSLDDLVEELCATALLMALIRVRVKVSLSVLSATTRRLGHQVQLLLEMLLRLSSTTI